MINDAILNLVSYAYRAGLIEECEYRWAINTLLDVLKIDTFVEPAGGCEAVLNDSKIEELELAPILEEINNYAVEQGIIKEDSVVYRDLFDTEVMGRLTPRPAQVISKFNELYKEDPISATDWYYEFSKNTNYIRRDRIAKDMQWKASTEYGEIDITINLSKPEKDPKAIAAARNMPKAAYPQCQLCASNEGYAGRINHPARQNHRIIPITINNTDWYLQYSPYVYYNEHCICFNSQHTPMKIDRACFEKLLDFVGQFPHYFVGSNADLPIVGGSILAHDHFQGGRYTFAMAKAPIETKISFAGFEDVEAGIVKWPMSVIRLSSKSSERLCILGEKILNKWRAYSDEKVSIYAQTNGEPHNTITPIARMRDGNFELDLVLRNNITTEEHPLGLFHPHSELHHIKKENIGLIEVMGLAVLPSRLKGELAILADSLVKGKDISADERIEKHSEWANELKTRYEFTEENAMDILKKEVGIVFSKVLEHAGVYKRTPEGKAAFLRFVEECNK